MERSLSEKFEDDENRRVILIAGPTASGKSALALDLARVHNGVIINADSMQLYEDLRIVSARPSIEEEAQAPHRLYGVLSASTAFSTGAWLKLASAEIDTVRKTGKTAILVGGTGLYFKALTEGFAELPEIPDVVRRKVRTLANDKGVSGLQSALRDLGDEDAANVLADPQRLARALEVLETTGKSLRSWQGTHQAAPFLSANEFSGFVLAPPRPWLHERIAQRARLMLSADGLAEVEALLARGLSDELPAMRAIGVSEIAAFLNGKCALAEVEWKLTVATRQYAKRQETWFRNQMAHWQRLDPSQETGLTRSESRYN